MATSKSDTKKTSSGTKKKTPAKSTKAKTKGQQEIKEKDPFFSEVKNDLALIGVIAVGVLVLIINFGFGGTVGGAISGFLFGVFGLIQYVLPVIFVMAVFFFLANKKNPVAIAKGIAAIIFLVFISVVLELISNKGLLSAGESYISSRDSHVGGGFIGGLIANAFTSWFSLVLAYVISAIILIICIIIISETFIATSMKDAAEARADYSKQKSINKRRQREEERKKHQAMYQQVQITGREERKRLWEEKKEKEKELLNQSEGPRADKKFSGITFDTKITPDTVTKPIAASATGEITEIKFNINDEKDIQVVDSKHTKLVSDIASQSAVNFKTEDAKVENPLKPSYESRSTENPLKPSFESRSTENPLKPSYESRNTENPLKPSLDSNKTENPLKPSLDSHKTENPLKPSLDSNKTEKTSKPLTAAKTAPVATPAASDGEYIFPPLDLLKEGKSSGGDSREHLNEMSERLIRTLKNFGVDATVSEVTQGPSVTRYEITIAEGVKVSKVVNLADDIKLNMAVTDLRMEAPIPGKSAIGIEVPNKSKVGVSLAELIKSSAFRDNKSKIAFCVGKDITGDIVIGNIEKFPHVLIAGATGSGKSVCINSIIMSILYHARPDEVKLIMVDPKQVELSVYKGIPHLLTDVITEPKRAAMALAKACAEMDRRYKLLSKYAVRNLESYNGRISPDGMITYTDDEGVTREEEAEKLPQIVIILDELADLMMVAGKEVETYICRLAQLARACGIHLIIATQRPTANVLTGLIKGNVPSRIAFSVASGLDSRVILDETGAESLLGHGDMLYHPSGTNRPLRLQGAFVTDDEISDVVEFIKANNGGIDKKMAEQFESQAVDMTEGGSVPAGSGNSVSISDGPDNSMDPLFVEAGKLVIESQKGSIGYLQRNFRIGFNRAARIMDQLTENGVVGPDVGTKPREIKMTMEQFEELLNSLDA